MESGTVSEFVSICLDWTEREPCMNLWLKKKDKKKKKRCSTARCYKMYSTVKRTRCQGISILHPVLLYCNNSVSVNYSSPCSERLPCRRCGAHTGGNTFCVFMCCCGDRNKAKWSLKGKKNQKNHVVCMKISFRLEKNKLYVKGTSPRSRSSEHPINF